MSTPTRGGYGNNYNNNRNGYGRNTYNSGKASYNSKYKKQNRSIFDSLIETGKKNKILVIILAVALLFLLIFTIGGKDEKTTAITALVDENGSPVQVSADNWQEVIHGCYGTQIDFGEEFFSGGFSDATPDFDGKKVTLLFDGDGSVPQNAASFANTLFTATDSASACNNFTDAYDDLKLIPGAKFGGVGETYTYVTGGDGNTFSGAKWYYAYGESIVLVEIDATGSEQFSVAFTWAGKYHA